MPKRLILTENAELVSVSLLNVHPKNVNQGDFGAIQQSIEENGFYGALVVNRRNSRILAGNHRFQVAISLGYAELPVTWVDVDEDEEERILLVDNRTARLGCDNTAKLVDFLTDLAKTDRGLAGTGYDGDDLDQLVNDLAGLTEEPKKKTPAEPENDVTRPCLIVFFESEEERDYLYTDLTEAGRECIKGSGAEALIKAAKGKAK